MNSGPHRRCSHEGACRSPDWHRPTSGPQLSLSQTEQAPDRALASLRLDGQEQLQTGRRDAPAAPGSRRRSRSGLGLEISIACRGKVADHAPALSDQTSHLPGVLGAITATASGHKRPRRRGLSRLRQHQCGSWPARVDAPIRRQSETRRPVDRPGAVADQPGGALWHELGWSADADDAAAKALAVA